MYTASGAAPVRNDKYPALTGVRFLGASVIFFDHFPLWPGAHIVLNVMAFFYALSGFLIVRIYHEQARFNRAWLTRYVVNRFARIYPVYFLLLSIAVCFAQHLDAWTLVTNYTLTHALFAHTRLIIQPSWSLTVEECFYFLAPLFMVLAKRGGFWTAAALAATMLLGALAVSTLHADFLHSPLFVLSTTFFGHFAEFFAGVYLALVVIRREKTRPPAGVAASGLAAPAPVASGSRYTLLGLMAVVVLVTAMMAVYRRPDAGPYAIILINNFLIPAPIGLLYWGLIRERSVLSALLSGGFVGLLGRSSYCFYLLHTLIIQRVSSLPAVATAARPLVVVSAFVGTWILAIVLYRVYEEPVNRWIRGRFADRTDGGSQPFALGVTGQVRE
jgi:peptidoglycan/LPS O-acetylase OafA/YrhL